MSFYSDASLVMIPSGYKDAKVYSAKPVDGSGDLDFSRGSDIEATRVNANGYIEKAQVNLLTYSNDFSNAAWTKTRSSLVGGQAGYDGTNDAWAYVDTTDNSTHLMVQSLTLGAQVATFSVYAKAAAVNFLVFRFEGATGVDYAYFNLATGSLGTIDADYIDVNITSVGGGWYRCEATRLLGASGNQAIILSAEADNDPTYAGAATTALYLQDAQLNYGLVAQTYQETTTAAVVSGITDNMPRLSYDPANPTCPSLLLEGSRSNAIAQSEFVDSWGVKTNISVVSNNGTSPEGVINASNIYPTITGASFFYEGSITYTSGTTYTYSVFAKANGKDYLQITTSGASFSNQYCTFDLALGATDNNGFESVGIEDYGNGWFRCYVVETSISTASSRFVIGLVSNANAGRLSSVTADGTNGVLIYGVVSETGSYPTSYIPTYGSSATRTGESCSKTGISSLIGQTEGTLFLDFVAVDTSSFQIIEQIRTTGSTNVGQVDIRLQSGNIRALATDGGVSQFTIVGPSLVAGTRYKCAVRYEANNAAFYINGASVGTDTSCSFTSSSLQQFSFNENAGSFLPSVEINQAILFPTALSNSDLATLTSL